MTKQPETITIDVPVSEIENPTAFIRDWRQARQEGPEALTELAEETMLKDGKDMYSRFETALDEDDPAEKAFQKSDQRRKEFMSKLQSQELFRLIMNEDTAEIEDISHVTVIPESEDSIKRKKQLQRNTPSGRKQNDASFRVSRW